MFSFLFIASIYLTILVLIAAFRQKAGPAERRVALVIGNAAYKWGEPLYSPPKDADAVADVLKRFGFEVVKKHNLQIDQREDLLRDLESRTKGAAWALVYYAGHGLQSEGENWLLPIDVYLTERADLPRQAISVERLLKHVNKASKLRIVLLDACRTNPFRTQMMMNEGLLRAAQGLAAMKPAYGEIVFFAARHDTQAWGWKDENRHSRFTEALLKHMEEDGLELGRFFRKVTSSVLKATNEKQEPFVYGRLPDEDFYLKPPQRSR
jgi:uncharacterized caspase-like protein